MRVHLPLVRTPLTKPRSRGPGASQKPAHIRPQMPRGGIAADAQSLFVNKGRFAAARKPSPAPPFSPRRIKPETISKLIRSLAWACGGLVLVAKLVVAVVLVSVAIGPILLAWAAVSVARATVQRARSSLAAWIGHAASNGSASRGGGPPVMAPPTPQERDALLREHARLLNKYPSLVLVSPDV